MKFLRRIICAGDNCKVERTRGKKWTLVNGIAGVKFRLCIMTVRQCCISIDLFRDWCSAFGGLEPLQKPRLSWARELERLGRGGEGRGGNITCDNLLW